MERRWESKVFGHESSTEYPITYVYEPSTPERKLVKIQTTHHTLGVLEPTGDTVTSTSIASSGRESKIDARTCPSQHCTILTPIL